MGLDITSYSHLQYLGHHLLDHEDDSDTVCGGRPDETGDLQHIEAYAYPDFPHALMGLPGVRKVEFSANSTFLSAGCFQITPATETVGFRAGSYSGYGLWRDDLREQFNPDRRPEGPFYELIWFADNEGTLAETAARSLLGDFRRYEGQYLTAKPRGADLWQQWTHACALAADGGLIDFH